MTDEISVVIPTLCRPSLERAVASAANQSLAPYEVIVVENGPERISRERVALLTELAGPIPLRVLSLPPYSGPSISRNLGAWEAKADYIAFLDDDDEFVVDYLEVMSTRISEDGPDVLYGALVRRNANGSIGRKVHIHRVSESFWLESLYRQENPGFCGTNVVVRREDFFKLGGFPVDLPSGEDRAFAMAALVAGSRVVCVDEAEVTVHQPQGYRANRRSDKWVTNLKLVDRYWSYVSWRSRLRVIWRSLRSFVKRQRTAFAARFRRG